MARIKTTTIALPLNLLKGEIDRWANSEAEDARNLSFLKAICQTFYNRAEEYYKAVAEPEDRLQRLEEICQALIEIGFTDGKRKFTVAAQYSTPPEKAEDLIEGAGCLPGERCIRGVCV